MKLKKFLGMTETKIEAFLKHKGFKYCTDIDSDYNYGWVITIVVDNPTIYTITIHCNLIDHILTITIDCYNEIIL